MHENPNLKYTYARNARMVGCTPRGFTATPRAACALKSVQFIHTQHIMCYVLFDFLVHVYNDKRALPTAGILPRL